MGKTNTETSKEMLDALKHELDPLYNTNRRFRAERLKVSFPVNVTLNGSPIHGWAEAENISFSGMLLLTNFPTNLLDELTLEFTLPHHVIPIQTLVRVVRITNGKFHDEPTVIAVSFLTQDPNVTKIISGFVLENLVC